MSLKKAPNPPFCLKTPRFDALLFNFYRKKELLKGIYMMGFNRPSKIQETALPIMLAYP